MSDSTRIPPGECPECGYHIDSTSAAYNYGGQKPSPGDISMCLSCGYASIFAADLSRRRPNKEESEAIMRSPEVKKAQRARAVVVGNKIRKRDNL
jgi:Zn ribbon nucleic-acid-binding protein